MTDISPIGRPNAASYQSSTPKPAPANSNGHGRVHGGDSVEFSQAARYLSMLRELPDVRQELVENVRAQINAGGYDSPEKIEAAIDGMMEDLA